MRVSYVLSMPYWPDHAGGAERWVTAAARALAAHVPVTLHYMARAGAEPLDAPPGARPHRFVAPPGGERDRFAISSGLLTEATGCDVVHVHQFGSLSAQAVAALARLRRGSTFATDLGSSGMAVGRRLGLDRLFHGFLELSRFAARLAPPEKVRVVYGGADLTRFHPGVRGEPPFALFVGRLMPHKGIDWLIRSLPEGVPLVVAGRPVEDRHPDYLGLLRGLAKDKHVRFELGADDERIAALAAGASVVVLPSVHRDVYGTHRRVPELLGLSLIEAMACGTPVVCARTASLPEVVRDGETGLVVEPHDERAMGRALEFFLRDPRRVEEFGQAARGDVLSRFTWDRVAERCLDAYEELGGARRG